MKHETVKRYVQVEQHFVSLRRKDLAQLLSDDENEIDERDLFVTVTVGQDAKKMFVAADILKRALAQMNEKDEEGNEVGAGIPADAEVTISIGWRREVEVGANQIPMHPPAPVQPAFGPGASPIMPPGAAPPFNPGDVGTHANCRTCGTVPDLHGPTPDCQDPAGCARVRAAKGNLPIVQANPEGPAPQVGAGGILPGQVGGMHGTQMLTNRETGERVFAAKDGMPYGVGYDYQR